jgi:predicted porin
MVRVRRDIVRIAAVMLLQVAVAVAHEKEGVTPTFSFNGFGTAGVVYSDEDQADFVAGTLAPDGVGATRDWSAEVDSRLGLQLSSDITRSLSGVVQLVAEQRYDDTYTPTVEWANLALDVTPDLSVRAGRMVLPSFMVSEYRKVGYANPWVRPPQEVYGIVPVSNTDGVQVSYRSRFDQFTNTLRASYGRNDFDLPGGGEGRARGGVTLVDTLEWGASTLFAQYSSVDLTLEQVNPLFNAFRQFGPPGDAIADRYDVNDTRFEFISLGARYDPGDWFVMGELAWLESRSFIGDRQGWYVTGGYRFGSITPYVTLAGADDHGNNSDPGLPPAGLPPPLAAMAANLNTGLNQLLADSTEQKSISAGARWDFARNVALKVQVDYLDLDPGSGGVLVNEQPGFVPGGSVTLFSVALDFVF